MTESHILAATDFSPPARHAVERGGRLAAACAARYSVCHVLELDLLDQLRDWLGDDLSAVKHGLVEEARQSLTAQLARLQQEFHIVVEPALVVGSPLREISALADALAIDLLVLGARGSNFLRHATLGSMASRLLRKSRRYAVLVVKQAAHEEYRRVLVAVDFSAGSQAAIAAARRFAPRAELLLFHAFVAPFEGKLLYAGVAEETIQHYRRAAREEALRRLAELATAAGLSTGEYTSLVVHGDPALRILEQEQERDCDLIVMCKHGRHLGEEFLLGSVTKHVLSSSQVDVLVTSQKG